MPTDPVNEKFETLGLESLYFINNLGSFFLVILVDILLCILALIIRLILWIKYFSKLKKFSVYLENGMFWKNWISTVMESYLIVSLSGMVLIKYSFDLETWGNQIQTASGILLFVIYLMIPIIAIVGFLKRFKEVGTRSMM